MFTGTNTCYFINKQVSGVNIFSPFSLIKTWHHTPNMGIRSKSIITTLAGLCGYDKCKVTQNNGCKFSKPDAKILEYSQFTSNPCKVIPRFVPFLTDILLISLCNSSQLLTASQYHSQVTQLWRRWRKSRRRWN